MNAIFALLALGHSPDDPLTAREIEEFSRFEIEEGDTIRVQNYVCFSGLGHGDRYGSPRGSGRTAESPRIDRGGELVARESNRWARRLDDQNPRGNAGGMEAFLSSAMNSFRMSTIPHSS